MLNFTSKKQDCITIIRKSHKKVAQKKYNDIIIKKAGENLYGV
jgi:hypothetical protein